jgi:hypothetical protein
LVVIRGALNSCYCFYLLGYRIFIGLLADITPYASRFLFSNNITQNQLPETGEKQGTTIDIIILGVLCLIVSIKIIILKNNL